MQEEVCTDLDGVSKWFYNPDEQTYARYKPDGEPDSATGFPRILAKLSGFDIPNPDMVWMRRCQAAGTTPSTIEGQAFKPSPVTYALFTHWQGVTQNA